MCTCSRGGCGGVEDGRWRAAHARWTATHETEWLCARQWQTQKLKSSSQPSPHHTPMARHAPLNIKKCTHTHACQQPKRLGGEGVSHGLKLWCRAQRGWPAKGRLAGCKTYVTDKLPGSTSHVTPVHPGPVASHGPGPAPSACQPVTGSTQAPEAPPVSTKNAWRAARWAGRMAPTTPARATTPITAAAIAGAGPPLPRRQRAAH